MTERFAEFEGEKDEPLSIVSDGHTVHIRMSGETRSEVFSIFFMGSPASEQKKKTPDGPGTFFMDGVPVQGYRREGMVNIHPTPEEYALMQQSHAIRRRERTS